MAASRAPQPQVCRRTRVKRPTTPDVHGHCVILAGALTLRAAPRGAGVPGDGPTDPDDGVETIIDPDELPTAETSFRCVTRAAAGRRAGWIPRQASPCSAGVATSSRTETGPVATAARTRAEIQGSQSATQESALCPCSGFGRSGARACLTAGSCSVVVATWLAEGIVSDDVAQRYGRKVSLVASPARGLDVEAPYWFYGRSRSPSAASAVW
jgi:hypothetical protein